MCFAINVLYCTLSLEHLLESWVLLLLLMRNKINYPSCIEIPLNWLVWHPANHAFEPVCQILESRAWKSGEQIGICISVVMVRWNLRIPEIFGRYWYNWQSMPDKCSWGAGGKGCYLAWQSSWKMLIWGLILASILFVWI